MTLRFRTHVSLPADLRTVLVDGLNVTLAATLDLSSQVKQAHWNVRGEQFFARHVMFDRLYPRLVGWTDQIAERVAQLGGYAEGTVRCAAAASLLKEHDLRAVLGAEHVRSLTDQYATLAALVRMRITTLEGSPEPVTVDLYTEVLRGLELDLWFLESHLEQGTARDSTRAARESAPSDAAARTD